MEGKYREVESQYCRLVRRSGTLGIRRTARALPHISIMFFTCASFPFFFISSLSRYVLCLCSWSYLPTFLYSYVVLMADGVSCIHRTYTHTYKHKQRAVIVLPHIPNPPYHFQQYHPIKYHSLNSQYYQWLLAQIQELNMWTVSDVVSESRTMNLCY